MTAEAKELSIREPDWTPPPVSLTITNQDEYVAVAGALSGVKEFQKRVEAWFKPLVEHAHASWRGLTQRREETLAPAKKFEAEVKTALADYDTKQEQLRLAEQRRLEAEARAQEETRRLAEAAALEAEGIAEGDEGKLAEAQELVSAPVETPPVFVEKAVPQVQGLSFRETWDARVTDLLKLIQHVAQHPEHVNLLTPNAKALRQQAQSLKGNMRIPGVQAYSNKNVAQR